MGECRGVNPLCQGSGGVPHPPMADPKIGGYRGLKKD
jgi:hypothetical protein